MADKAPRGILRVLVCGGRAFRDAEMLNGTLDRLHASYPFRVVIAGGAPGADTLAVEWAELRGVDFIIEPADWDQDGRAAGPIRNQRMLDKHKPSHCVAFPGGRGTADMIRRAKKAGLSVMECHFPPGRTMSSTPSEALDR